MSEKYCPTFSLKVFLSFGTLLHLFLCTTLGASRSTAFTFPPSSSSAISISSSWRHKSVGAHKNTINNNNYENNKKTNGFPLSIIGDYNTDTNCNRKRYWIANVKRYSGEIKEKNANIASSQNQAVKTSKNETIQPEDIVVNTDIGGLGNIEMDEKTKRILEEISASKKKRNEAAERLEKGWKEIQASDKKKMKEVESAQEVTLKILEKRKGDIDRSREVVEQLVDELENSFQSKLYRFLEKVLFLDLRRAVAVVLLVETIYISYLVGVADVEDSSIIVTSLGIEMALGLFYAFLSIKEKAKDA